MDTEAYVSKYYSRFVFTSPKLTSLIAAYVLLLTLLCILKASMGYVESVFYLIIVALLASNILTFIMLKRSVLRAKNFLRRVLVLLNFVLLHLLLFESLLAIVFGLKYPFLITYCGYSFIHYLLIRPKRKVLESIIEASIPVVAYYVFVSVFVKDLILLLLALGSLVSALMGELYFLTLRKYSKMGDFTLKFSEAFLELWFANNKKPLEEVLEKNSVNDEVWVKVFTIVDKCSGNVKGVIALTSIHAGPFRNVGSSKVIANLRNTLKKIYGNVPVAIFHTTTTHEKDLVSSRYLKEALEELVRTLKANSYDTIEKIHGLFNLCIDNQCAYIIGLDKVPLILLYNSKNGIDDLPTYLNDALERKIRKIEKLKDIFLIEAHNSKPEGIRNVAKEMNYYRKLIEEALPKIFLNDESKKSLKIGIAEVVDAELIGCRDLCSPAINAIAFEHNDRISVLVVYDGNNALEDFRNIVKDEVRKLNENIVFAEITTTDNHEKTGYFGGQTYVPVGASKCRSVILKLTVDAVKKALSSISECKLKYFRVNIKTKILGSLGYRVLEGIVKDLKITVSLFFALNFSSYILVSTPIVFIYGSLF